MTVDADGTDKPVRRLVGLLHKELRTAWAAALGRGAAPMELSGSIAERLRRLRAAGANGLA